MVGRLDGGSTEENERFFVFLSLRIMKSRHRRRHCRFLVVDFWENCVGGHVYIEEYEMFANVPGGGSVDIWYWLLLAFGGVGWPKRWHIIQAQKRIVYADLQKAK